MKVGSRTVRKDMKVEYQEFIDQLYEDGKTYLLHRFECKNDIHY